jgi:hypothetical protein
VELENTEIKSEGNRIPRIDNPANYPRHYYPTSENQPLNSSYGHREQIFPTRSEMERDNVYFGNHINPNLKGPVPKYNFLKDLKKRVVTTAENIEDKYTKSMIKHRDKQLK